MKGRFVFNGEFFVRTVRCFSLKITIVITPISYNTFISKLRLFYWYWHCFIMNFQARSVLYVVYNYSYELSEKSCSKNSCVQIPCNCPSTRVFREIRVHVLYQEQDFYLILLGIKAARNSTRTDGKFLCHYHDWLVD